LRDPPDSSAELGPKESPDLQGLPAVFRGSRVPPDKSAPPDPQDRLALRERKALPVLRLRVDKAQQGQSVRLARQDNRLQAPLARPVKSVPLAPRVPWAPPAPQGSRLPAPLGLRVKSGRQVPPDPSARRDKVLQAPKDPQDRRDPPDLSEDPQDPPDRSVLQGPRQDLSVRRAPPVPRDKSVLPVPRDKSVRPARRDPLDPRVNAAPRV